MITLLWLILAFFSLLLTVIEFPAWINWLNPYWIILFITFWFYYRPTLNQLWAIFFLSFIFDSLMQLPFGVHGVGVLPFAFILMKYSHFFKNASLIVQVIIITAGTAWMLGVFQWFYLKDSPFIGAAYNWGVIKLFSTGASWVVIRFISQAIWGKRIDYYG